MRRRKRACGQPARTATGTVLCLQVVYHSYEGRFSDNPRALFQTLRALGGEHRHVWLADPEHVDRFPPGVETVLWGSPEGREALEAADVVIANTHTDTPWRKREGATYLQTWHGTPLKRIHHDVLWAPPGRLDRLSLDVAEWDALLSASPFATGALRHAFAFGGEVLETGYPRNDVLNAPGREAIRAGVRERLGIPDGVTAVLYTPTWRDDFVFASAPRELVLELDVERFGEQLGEDHCLLLRTHYLLTGRLRAARHPAVRDVSFEPEVAELYLAADVMVTDYSSTMFDFAVTGKPMVFFAYDLEHYRDVQRGFYFDLVPEAPGPVVTTTDEVIAAVRDIAVVREAYADRYAAFAERYCPWEDGGASRRVLERLGLGLPGRQAASGAS